jgi:hypothetical protein
VGPKDGVNGCGFDPRTVQPIASFSSDYTIQADSSHISANYAIKTVVPSKKKNLSIFN